MSPTFVRRALTSLVLAATLGTCSACFPQGPTLRPFTNTPTGTTHLVLFGDSLGAMAEQPTTQIWAGDPTLSVSYNAVGGTRFQHWAAAMANVTPDEVVVMELGTNNVSNEAINTGELPGNLHAALDELADAACVVVPNLNTEGGDRRGFPYAERTRWVNAELARLVAAGTYPNLHVYDWASQSAGHPEWLMGAAASPPDWVHMNGPNQATGFVGGTQVYAEMLVAAAEVCA